MAGRLNPDDLMVLCNPKYPMILCPPAIHCRHTQSAQTITHPETSLFKGSTCLPWFDAKIVSVFHPSMEFLPWCCATVLMLCVHSESPGMESLAPEGLTSGGTHMGLLGMQL